MIIDLTGINDRERLDRKLAEAVARPEAIILLQMEKRNSFFDEEGWRESREELDKTEYPASPGCYKVRVSYTNPFDKIELSRETLFPQPDVELPSSMQAYLGTRTFKLQRKSQSEIQRAIDRINRSWDCIESKKIQDWYLENNTEYREQIAEARRNEDVECVEIVVSARPEAEIRALVAEYANRNSPRRGRPIKPLASRIVEASRGFNKDRFYEDDSFASSYTYSYSSWDEEASGEEEDGGFGSSSGSSTSWTSSGSYYEPSDEDLEELREQAYSDYEYSERRKRFEAEEGGDYDDYLYHERLREGEE